MQATSTGSLDQRTDGASALPVPLLFTVPDPERLLVQSGLVRNQLEAELLRELEARVRQATLLHLADVSPDLVTMNSRLLLRDVDTGQHMT